jgi:hypothetical protein
MLVVGILGLWPGERGGSDGGGASGFGLCIEGEGGSPGDAHACLSLMCGGNSIHKQSIHNDYMPVVDCLYIALIHGLSSSAG